MELVLATEDDKVLKLEVEVESKRSGFTYLDSSRILEKP
jgi:hypothetical protein